MGEKGNGKRILRLKQRFTNQLGFTLVELMAVLTILAIIIAIAVPAIGSIIEKGKKTADETSIDLMEDAGENAYVDDRIDFDGPEPESYTIPTLIEEGYLKLDEDHKFNQPENYVTKKNDGGEFVWMGDGSLGDGGDVGAGGPVGGVETALTCPEAEADGYTCIYNEDELNDVRNDLDGKFILMNDIDVAAYSPWTPIGDYYGAFEGELNGNGYAVMNLSFAPITDVYEYGFFGNVAAGDISNLTLDGAVQTGDGTMRDAAFLIGMVESDYSSNADANPLTLSNISLTGTASNHDYFAALIGRTTSNNPIAISDVHVDMTTSDVDTVSGLMSTYETDDVTAALSVRGVEINGELIGTASAAGVIDDIYVSDMDGAFVFDDIAVNANMTGGKRAVGFSSTVDNSSRAETFTLSNMDIAGDMTATVDSNPTAHGFVDNYMTYDAKHSLIENINVTGAVTTTRLASGFIGALGYYNGLPGDVNEIRNISINSVVTGGSVGMFSNNFEPAFTEADMLVKDVAIRGTANMSQEYATILELELQDSSGDLILEGFDVEVAATHVDGASAAATQDSAGFAKFVGAYDNTGDFIVRDSTFNTDLLAGGRAFGFVGEVTHETDDAAQRVSIDGITVLGSLESVTSDVGGFTSWLSHYFSSGAGVIDVRNVTIDAALVANNGTAFAPATVEDMRSYYATRAQYGTSYSLADSSASVVETISGTYDLSNHSGAVNAVRTY